MIATILLVIANCLFLLGAIIATLTNKRLKDYNELLEQSNKDLSEELAKTKNELKEQKEKLEAFQLTYSTLDNKYSELEKQAKKKIKASDKKTTTRKTTKKEETKKTTTRKPRTKKEDK